MRLGSFSTTFSSRDPAHLGRSRGRGVSGAARAAGSLASLSEFPRVLCAEGASHLSYVSGICPRARACRIFREPPLEGLEQASRAGWPDAPPALVPIMRNLSRRVWSVGKGEDFALLDAMEERPPSGLMSGSPLSIAEFWRKHPTTIVPGLRWSGIPRGPDSVKPPPSRNSGPQRGWRFSRLCDSPNLFNRTLGASGGILTLCAMVHGTPGVLSVKGRSHWRLPLRRWKARRTGVSGDCLKPRVWVRP